MFALPELEVREGGEPTRSEDRTMTYRLQVRGMSTPDLPGGGVASSAQ